MERAYERCMLAGSRLHDEFFCPQEVKESFSGMKNLERCFYPLHTGVRYVGAPLELRRLAGTFSRGRPVSP